MKRNISKQTLSFSTSKSMQFLRTPVDIWGKLSTEFNFTLDACASDKNHLLPKYYTKETDCLKQDWTGEVVYCHPMFDMHIGDFVEKAFNSKCLTVMLLPASTHTRYFHKFIYNNPNVEIRFLEKPKQGFNFGNDDGTIAEIPKGKVGYIKPLMIVIFKNDKKEQKDKTKTIEFEYFKTPLNKYTFSVKPIRDWIEKNSKGKVLNLFAGKTKLNLNEVRVDSDKTMNADFYMDAYDFVIQCKDKFDTIILDPPYAYRKSMEMYNGHKASKFNQIKDLIPLILNKGGIVITFGYHSVSMGQKRGFKQQKILLMSHGGAIHDTIAVIEYKIDELHEKEGVK